MKKSTQPSSSTTCVWYAYVACLQDPKLRQRCLGLLDATEQSAHARLLVPQAQDAYLLAHALCRVALSHHAEELPTAWRFAPQPQGKPMIVAPRTARGLHFNISHSRSMAVVAISSTYPVGVDVEDAHRPINVLSLAPRVLTAREHQACAQQPAPARAFLHHWTLKEAYLKAQGQGISEGLTGIDMQVDPASLDLPVMVRDMRGHDASTEWHLRLLPIDPHHVVAAAVQASSQHSTFVCRDAMLLL